MQILPIRRPLRKGPLFSEEEQKEKVEEEKEEDGKVGFHVREEKEQEE